MGNTVILIHGRAQKPAGDDLKAFWLEALRFGVDRDHPNSVGALDQARIQFV